MRLKGMKSSESSDADASAGATPAIGGNQFSGRIRRVIESVDRRYKGTSAEAVWNRLRSVDFVNRGILFAGVLFLCLFPFMLVVSALAGRNAVTSLVRHLGLTPAAAADLSRDYAPVSATSNSITGLSWVFLVIGGMAAATAVQELYERTFDLRGGGLSDYLRRLVWLAVFVGCWFFVGWAGPRVRDAGGPVLVVIVGLVGLTVFWGFTMRFLLAGRVHWRHVLPSAVATAIFWVGMEVVFSLFFSSAVISDYKKYGSIGINFVLMSYFIAIGVVLILGAVVGVVWRERGLSLGGALRRLVPKRSRLPGR
jgi:membrane protein